MLKLLKGSTYEIFMLTFPYSTSFPGAAISLAILCAAPCSPTAPLPLSPVNSPGLKAPLVSFQEKIYDISYATALPGLLSAHAVCNLSGFLSPCDSLSQPLSPSTSLTPLLGMVSYLTASHYQKNSSNKQFIAHVVHQSEVKTKNLYSLQ